MSRHRHVRNLNLDDYLDDYANDIDYDDYDDTPDPDSAHYTRTNDPVPHVQTPAQHGLDADLLADIVQNFRQILQDDALTADTVDAAMREADYDWELALATLKSRTGPAAAPQAAPSPIAALLADDADHLPAHPAPPATAAPAPDYDAFVADLGAALAPAPTSDDPPFRFDKPSPDDLVRAHQARAAVRPSAPLRLPRPALPRTRADVTAPPSSNPTPPPPSTPGKLTKLPKPAKTRPGRVEKSEKTARTDTTKAIKQRTKPLNLKVRIAAVAPSTTVVVAGHVDAGKSTLVGHLLLQAGGTTVGSARRKPDDLAWGTDEDAVERSRGVTIDFATRLLSRPSKPGKQIALIDAPGHRDFVPAMITGASQASAALLVVDASPGECEAGLSPGGQTREHAVVLRAVGVSWLIVVVNKLDVVGYDRTRFEEVRVLVKEMLVGCGWRAGRGVSFIPVAGRDGINLASRSPQGHALRSWWGGRCLLEELDNVPERSRAEVDELASAPTRLVVSDCFRSVALGGQIAVAGRMLGGSVAARDHLRVVPGGDVSTVKSVMIGDSAKVDMAIAGVDGVPISLGLTDLPDGMRITPGSVLCDPENIVAAGVSFRARILVVGHDAVVFPGMRGILHVGGSAEAGCVQRLVELVNGKKDNGTGEAGKAGGTSGTVGGRGARGGRGTRGGRGARGGRGGRGSRGGRGGRGSHGGARGGKFVPRRVVRSETAIIEMRCDRAVAIESSEKNKALGRFAFRQDGQTIGVGIVLEVLKTLEDVRLEEEARMKAREAHREES